MRKRVLAFGLVLVFALGITAQAAPMRTPTKKLSLSFQGTTATCAATVRADDTTDKVNVTMKLWHNGTAIKTWTESGTYVIHMSKSATVAKGETYKLTMDATINGVKQPTQSVSKTCP